jgi:hypothetical protein
MGKRRKKVGGWEGGGGGRGEERGEGRSQAGDG